LIARLFDSVAPLVKTISFAEAPTSAGHLLAAPLDGGFSASHPKRWLRLAALPNCRVKNGSIASSTRGSTGVVAW
jgi:hypothetical protein